MLQVVLVDVLHSGPAQTKVGCRLADGHYLHQVDNKPLQAMRRMPLACSERYPLLLVTTAGTTLDTLDTHVDIDRLAANGNTAETADSITISYDFLTSTLRTA